MAIDVIAGSSPSQARIDAYDDQGQLIARAVSDPIPAGTHTQLVLALPALEIDYVEIGAHGSQPVQLDRLIVGPETRTTTDDTGGYHFEQIPAGDYTVVMTAPQDFTFTTPNGGEAAAQLPSGGFVRMDDFGADRIGDAKLWQNPNNPADVNAENGVTPVDALLVVVDLNTNGARPLLPHDGATYPPDFLDVSGDDFLSPRDVLLVIVALDELNQNGGSGEAEASLTWWEPSPASSHAASPAVLPSPRIGDVPAWPASPLPAVPGDRDAWDAGGDGDEEESAAARAVHEAVWSDPAFADEWDLARLRCPAPRRVRR